jgi:hypothetical protein
MKQLASFEDVMSEIQSERMFQYEKFEAPGKPYPNGHTLGGWLLILRLELYEAETAAIKGGTGRNHVLHEIAQIATVAVACLQQHGLDFLTEKRDV